MRFLHREAEKRNHFSFMNKSFNMQCSLTKFSTLIVSEYYHTHTHTHPHTHTRTHTHTHTHTRLTAPFPGLPGWASTRKVKPIWILLKQERVSGSGIRWDICKSAPRCRQIGLTTPAPYRSVFYRPDALPATQPTASEHWRHKHWRHIITNVTYLISGICTNFRMLPHVTVQKRWCRILSH